MTSAYVLIAAILVLGGLLAALGDRIGTKVGKARLRLFNLRPRQTAVLVTIFTGTLIAASTLGILFATSKSLRQGIFQLDQILNKRREVQRELERVSEEKAQVEQELAQAQTAQTEAQQRLDGINRKFQAAQAQLRTISEQVEALRQEVESLQAERQQLQSERDRLQAQIEERDQKLSRQEQEIASQQQEINHQQELLQSSEARLQELETQRSNLRAEIEQRDQKIAQLDELIAKRDQVLQEREARLENLEQQISFLREEVASLEQYYQYYQALRQGNLALVRGQILSFSVVRIYDSRLTAQVVDEILQEANQAALEATHPGNEEMREQVLLITKSQVEQLRDEIDDGEDYVVQILSAGNYVRGEKRIRVFADVVPNQEVFNQGEIVATVTLDSAEITQGEMQERLDLLLAASQFRARRAGMLGKIEIEDSNLGLIRFIEQLNQSEIEFEQIRAIALETTYTAGPLKLQLVALRDGKIVFRS